MSVDVSIFLDEDNTSLILSGWGAAAVCRFTATLDIIALLAMEWREVCIRPSVFTRRGGYEAGLLMAITVGMSNPTIVA